MPPNLPKAQVCVQYPRQLALWLKVQPIAKEIAIKCVELRTISVSFCKFKLIQSEDDAISTEFIVAFDLVLIEHFKVFHLGIVPR